MFKKYKVLKWGIVSISVLLVIVVLFGVWFMRLIPPRDESLPSTTTNDLPYITENRIPVRGKVLIVVTSTEQMGESDKKTGYELTELARAYYVFQANGYQVDIASPLGGKPPVVIDDEDMGQYDFAFLNDTEAQEKVSHSLSIDTVESNDYEGIFFVGGKGAMFDFPENEAIQAIVRHLDESNKTIGAVCHGPAALVNVTLNNGKSILEDKEVSSFTNSEELLLIPDAASIFPFLLQDKIIAQGGHFNEGVMYLEKVSADGNLITGQNPWSVWAVAEAMVKQMGHTPKNRPITKEENAVKILEVYAQQGKQAAKELIERMFESNSPIDRTLIAKHSIIGAMQVDVGRFYDILGLTSFIKNCESKKKKG